MSAKASGRVWDLDLPHNKRLVLLAMADHADHEGRNIYPSTDLIAWKTGYSFRQVQRIIDTLIEDGILVEIKPARQQKPATYALDFKAGTLKPPFDPVARKAQSRQSVISEGRQNGIPERRHSVTPEHSRDDISDTPGMTFRASRDDTAMSSEPWNHDHEPTTTTESERRNAVVADGFFRELRRRNVSRLKAREIASMNCDQAHVLHLIDTRPNPNDPHSLGTVINDIIDGVAGDYVAPRALPKNGTPLAATKPNIPETIVSPAEVARRMRERQ